MSKTKADSRTRFLQAAEKTTYLCGFGNVDCRRARPGSARQRLLLLQDRMRSAEPSLSCAFRDSSSLRNLAKPARPKNGFVLSWTSRSRIAALAMVAACRHLCSSCKNMAARRQRNLESCSRALVWMTIRALGKADSRASPYIFYLQRKAYQYSPIFHDPTVIATEPNGSRNGFKRYNVAPQLEATETVRRPDAWAILSVLRLARSAVTVLTIVL